MSTRKRDDVMVTTVIARPEQVVNSDEVFDAMKAADEKDPDESSDWTNESEGGQNTCAPNLRLLAFQTAERRR
jgi:hypothetical protein